MAMLARAILFVTDLDRMVGFYRTAFSLPVRSEEPGFVVLGEEGMELALHAVPVHIAERIEFADPPAPRTDTPVKLVFVVADLSRARSAVEAAGGRTREPWSIGNRRLCDGTDPEGNVIQMSE